MGQVGSCEWILHLGSGYLGAQSLRNIRDTGESCVKLCLKGDKGDSLCPERGLCSLTMRHLRTSAVKVTQRANKGEFKNPDHDLI